MTAPNLKVAILTNILPSYRQGFYDRLFARDDVAVTVYCQTAIPGVNVRPIHERYPGRVKLVTSSGLRGEALVWQSLPWREVVSGYDVVFVDGNPRILSHALIATWLRLRRHRVVLWTMGHSYAAGPITERIRLAWTRLFPRIFLYTETEVRFLRARGFVRHDLSAMNNGLDQRQIDAAIAGWPPARLEEWRRARGLAGKIVLLSCARLDPKNHFEQVIDALPHVIRDAGDVVWCVVGSGAAADDLKARVAAAGLDAHVQFAGEIYEEAELAPWFLSATLLVHPAAIGLSLLHAFGYGLPVVTHAVAAHHGPEFSAFEEGRTGRTFREGDVADFAAVTAAVIHDPRGRTEMSAYVQHLARTRFNTDVMVERFVELARRAAGAAS